MRGLKAASAVVVVAAALGVFASGASAGRPASTSCSVTGFDGVNLTFVCTSSNGDTLNCTASTTSFTLTCTAVVSGATYTCTLGRGKTVSCSPALPVDPQG
jgi:hypothetical protein